MQNRCVHNALSCSRTPCDASVMLLPRRARARRCAMRARRRDQPSNRSPPPPRSSYRLASEAEEDEEVVNWSGHARLPL